MRTQGGTYVQSDTNDFFDIERDLPGGDRTAGDIRGVGSLFDRPCRCRPAFFARSLLQEKARPARQSARSTARLSAPAAPIVGKRKQRGSRPKRISRFPSATAGRIFLGKNPYIYIIRKGARFIRRRHNSSKMLGFPKGRAENAKKKSISIPIRSA